MKEVMEKESKILLVEDNMKSMQHVSSILNDAGYQTVLALNGQNAITWMMQEQFDLVIFDLIESQLSGFDVIAQVKDRGYYQDIPIVFLTSREEKENLMQGVRVPAVDFVTKPFRREELLTRINNQLALRKSKKQIQQNQELTDSIKYAYRIQKSMLPAPDAMEAVFPEHFIVNIPLNIVSGDFYWMKKVDHLVLFAVADCTGHGVPGAFLSVMGISLLNELSMKYRLDYPHVMLDNLRRKFKDSLRRSGINTYASEGIDMVLGMIDTRNLRMHASGAFNSVFLSRNGEIRVFRGDRQPVGFYPNETPFRDHVIQLERGDQLYFTSDGLIDQIGGNQGKKFQNSRFKQLLEQMDGMSMSDQKHQLINQYNQWKGSYDQVDDILAMGIKI